MHGNGTSLLSCLKCQQERASVGERSTNHINWHGTGSARPALHCSSVPTLILYNLVAHISILIMSLYIVHIYELVNYF